MSPLCTISQRQHEALRSPLPASQKLNGLSHRLVITSLSSIPAYEAVEIGSKRLVVRISGTRPEPTASIGF